MERTPQLLVWIDKVLSAAKLPTEGIVNEESFKNVLKKTDVHWTHYDEGIKQGMRIEVFLGKNRFFVVVCGAQKKRQKFMRQVLLQSRFVGSKK